MNVLEQYNSEKPNPQSVLDLFRNEWSSAMPTGSNLKSTPGNAALFEDVRIKWVEEVFKGFKDLDVLELGPLEGGHSYMLQKGGAKSVLALEANSRAYLKCLAIKEIFDLNRVKFLLGDFNAFLEEDEKKYDLVIAAGILYHLTQPVRLIDLITHRTDKIYLQTHYYDQKIISSTPHLKEKFAQPQNLVYQEFKYQAAHQNYNEALDWQGFCGGPETESVWLTRSSIINCLKYFEFTDIEIAFEDPYHPHGPIFSICARRKSKPVIPPPQTITRSTIKSLIAGSLNKLAKRISQ